MPYFSFFRIVISFQLDTLFGFISLLQR